MGPLPRRWFVVAVLLLATAVVGACAAEASDEPATDPDPSAAGQPASGAGGIGGDAGQGQAGVAGAMQHEPSAGAGAAGLAPAGVGGQDAAGMLATDPKADAAVSDASMDAPVAACDRTCLSGFNTAYLEALIARDAASLPLADAVRFTENGAELALTEGLWAVATALGDYRQDFAEVPAGQTASFVSLEDAQGAVLLAVRLHVVEHQITEIETIVARRGEVMFFSPDGLMSDPLYDESIAPAEVLTRERLVEITDLYLEGLENGDGSGVPFDSRASRNENGVVTASGPSISNLGVFSYIEEIKRRYVLVDQERGIALPFVLFEIPNGLTGSRTLHLAELFKISNESILKIQAIMVNQPLGTPSGWE